MIVTRFAPSPTGFLHLGHAASALFAFEIARRAGGRFLLRIEDIDPTRCKSAYSEALLEDLAWLGLVWEEPVRRQSEHFDVYEAALDKLKAQGLLYPCFCTRKEILAEAARAGHAPHQGEETLYPGICRAFSAAARERLMQERTSYAWRLDMKKAIERVGPLYFEELGKGKVPATPERFGDVILARKETPTSYHLSVTLDDAIQGVTLVTRGADLFEATSIHRLLQALLDLPVPRYAHHPLLLDSSGKRFAKRDKAITLRVLRAEGHSPQELCDAIFQNNRFVFPKIA